MVGLLIQAGNLQRKVVKCDPIKTELLFGLFGLEKSVEVSWFNLRSRFFFCSFWGGKGKQRTPDTLKSRVVCRHIIKVSVIVSDFTGNSSGLQRRRLLSKCIYLLYRQAENVKLIHHRPCLQCYCCESCLIVAVWYLCSNGLVKQINNSLGTNVEQPKSVFYWKWSKE